MYQLTQHARRCGNVAAILELDENLNKNFKVSAPGDIACFSIPTCTEGEGGRGRAMDDRHACCSLLLACSSYGGLPGACVIVLWCAAGV